MYSGEGGGRESGIVSARDTPQPSPPLETGTASPHGEGDASSAPTTPQPVPAAPERLLALQGPALLSQQAMEIFLVR